MPQYADLSTNAKADLDELLALVRPLAAEIHKFAQKNRVALQQWFSTPPGDGSTIADLVNGLDAGALLPNKTGLSGANEVTKEGLQTVMSYVSTVAALDSEGHLDASLPFAGAANFIP